MFCVRAAVKRKKKSSFQNFMPALRWCFDVNSPAFGSTGYINIKEPFYADLL